MWVPLRVGLIGSFMLARQDVAKLFVCSMGIALKAWWLRVTKPFLLTCCPKITADLEFAPPPNSWECPLLIKENGIQSLD